MKLYVITSGEYSDYGIECIFTDRAKAENYLKYHEHEDWWSDMRIEEYESQDDKYTIVTNGYHNVIGQCVITVRGRVERFNYRYKGLSDTPIEADKTEIYSHYSDDVDWDLEIIRSFPESTMTKVQAEFKMESILSDTAHEIAHLRLEGHKLKDIVKMLNLTLYDNNY